MSASALERLLRLSYAGYVRVPIAFVKRGVKEVLEGVKWSDKTIH